MELTAGCHFTREEADKLQKGLRFRFLESHGLIEGCLIAGSIRKEKSPELTRGDRCGVGGQFTMWKAVPHNGRTVAPEAILFESPCRAHPET